MPWKAVSWYEIHTGGKTYGKLPNKKWKKSSQRHISGNCSISAQLQLKWILPKEISLLADKRRRLDCENLPLYVKIQHSYSKQFPSLPRIITQTSAVTHCKKPPFHVQIHSGSPSLTLRCEVIPKLPRKDNKTSCMTGLVCNTISFHHSSHTQWAVIPTPFLTPLQQSHHHGWVTSALSFTVFLVGNRNQGRKAGDILLEESVWFYGDKPKVFPKEIERLLQSTAAQPLGICTIIPLKDLFAELVIRKITFIMT